MLHLNFEKFTQNKARRESKNKQGKKIAAIKEIKPFYTKKLFNLAE